MGLYSGSVAITAYRLVGYEQKSLKILSSQLLPHQARDFPLTGSTRQERIGWVLPLACREESGGDDGYWDMSHCQYEDGYLLRLRWERRRVAHELLQHLWRQRQREQSLMQENGRELSRPQKRELREALHQELLQKALPQLLFADIFWDHSGQLFLFSAARGMQAAFSDLFKKTFADPLGWYLQPLSLPLLGLGESTWQNPGALLGAMTRWRQSVPAVFAEGHL